MKIRSEIGYLGLMTIKNAIKQQRHYPLRFALLLLLFLLLLLAIIYTSIGVGYERLHPRPMSEIYACLLALYGCQYVLGCLKGVSSDYRLFSMADVRLLLTSPISATKLLRYGFMKQLDSAIIISLFMLLQYPWLLDTYHLPFGHMLAMAAGYLLTAYCSALTSLWLYLITVDKIKLRSTLRVMIICLFGCLLLNIFAPILASSTTTVHDIVEQLNSEWVLLIPIAGWIVAAIKHLEAAHYYPMMITILPVAAYALIGVMLLRRTTTDYFEDVLQQAETTYYTAHARKQSLTLQTMRSRVKLGQVGVGNGDGEKILHRKLLLEQRRIGWLAMYGTSILFAALAIVFAIMFEVDGIMPVFIFSAYVLLFTSASGIWLRELELPYVHLMPASPLQKLLQIARSYSRRMIVEAIIIFVPVGILQHASALEILACILCWISYGFLMMAGNMMTLRLSGARPNRMMSIALYAVMMMIIAAPGIGLGVWVAEALISISSLNSILLIMAVMMIWNLLLALLITLLGRKLIDKVDILS